MWNNKENRYKDINYSHLLIFDKDEKTLTREKTKSSRNDTKKTDIHM